MNDFDDLDWLAEAQPSTEPPDELATRRACTALLVHARSDGRPVAAPKRVAPARRARERRWLRPSRVLALAGATAVAVFAVTSIPAGDRVAGSLGGSPRVEDATAAPLVRLSERVADQPAPAGNATLVRRVHSFPDQPGFKGFDLYVDDGRYYYGATMAELKQAIRKNWDQGNATAREVVAAEQAAASRDAAAGRAAMIAATWAENGDPPDEPKLQDDNRVWLGCMDALLAGAGDPDVRSGVLFLLSTISAVSVEKTTRDGRETLAIVNTGFPGNPGQPDAKGFPGGYVETLYVDDESGVPVGFTGGVAGEEPSVTMSYDIERTTPARVKNG